MIAPRCGEARAQVYCLAKGELLDWVEAEQGDTIQKVGLVPFPSHAHLLYTLVRGGAGQLAGAMYHTGQGAWLWRLELGAEFCYQEDSLYSLYTPRGLLMFGRHAGDAGQVGEVTRTRVSTPLCRQYPYTWAWRGWSYASGRCFYSSSLETEFPMVLADWAEGALVTPRAMTHLHTR